MFWGPAGNFHYTTHWTEFTNNTATLLIKGLTKGDEGVYSANYMGDSPLYGTYMRLIVRGTAAALRVQAETCCIFHTANNMCVYIHQHAEIRSGVLIVTRTVPTA